MIESKSHDLDWDFGILGNSHGEKRSALAVALVAREVAVDLSLGDSVASGAAIWAHVQMFAFGALTAGALVMLCSVGSPWESAVPDPTHALQLAEPVTIPPPDASRRRDQRLRLPAVRLSGPTIEAPLVLEPSLPSLTGWPLTAERALEPRSSAAPCPVPSLSVEGGASVETPCLPPTQADEQRQ